MQFESFLKFFDTTEFSVEHPVSPEGYLFTYYPSEAPAALHYHNFLEIGYCERGTGIFIVDGEVIPFNDKCVSIIYDGQVHIAKSIQPEKSLWHFLYVDLNKLFLGPDLVRLKPLKSFRYQWYKFPNIIHFNDDPGLYHLTEKILDEAAQSKEGHLHALQGLVYALLIHHGRYMEERNLVISMSEQAHLLSELSDLLNFISSHYTEDLTVEQLCAAAKMSKPTMQRKLIACTGFAPMQYVHHLRLNHATALLHDRAMPIAEVAAQAGYNSISSFNRKFIAKFGISPSQWRHLHSSGR